MRKMFDPSIEETVRRHWLNPDRELALIGLSKICQFFPKYLIYLQVRRVLSGENPETLARFLSGGLDEQAKLIYLEDCHLGQPKMTYRKILGKMGHPCHRLLLDNEGQAIDADLEPLPSLYPSWVVCPSLAWGERMEGVHLTGDVIKISPAILSIPELTLAQAVAPYSSPDYPVESLLSSSGEKLDLREQIGDLSIGPWMSFQLIYAR